MPCATRSFTPSVLSFNDNENSDCVLLFKEDVNRATCVPLKFNTSLFNVICAVMLLVKYEQGLAAAAELAGLTAEGVIGIEIRNLIGLNEYQYEQLLEYGICPPSVTMIIVLFAPDGTAITKFVFNSVPLKIIIPKLVRLVFTDGLESDICMLLYMPFATKSFTPSKLSFKLNVFTVSFIIGEWNAPTRVELSTVTVSSLIVTCGMTDLVDMYTQLVMLEDEAKGVIGIVIVNVKVPDE
jgi:hypothetical protein